MWAAGVPSVGGEVLDRQVAPLDVAEISEGLRELAPETRAPSVADRNVAQDADAVAAAGGLRHARRGVASATAREVNRKRRRFMPGMVGRAAS